ncbi:unnamed protein product [Absidia cylindrospora]
MYSHYQQQQDIHLSRNDCGQPMYYGFYFSNLAHLAPEFSLTMNHQPSTANSFDFYQPSCYSMNNMMTPSNDLYAKVENMNDHQQLLNTELSLMAAQNYWPSVSYEDVHLMTVPTPGSAIPASPLSSAFSSSSSPPMDDFLSMDGTQLSDFQQHFVSPIITTPTKTAAATPKRTTKKRGQSILHINNDSMKKKKKQTTMLPPLGEFFCDFDGCGKVFGRKYNLSSHRVTHYAERKFFCDHCTKAFVRRHDLKRHTRIHTGETPHKCTYCDRGFGRADALQRHYHTDNTCALFYTNDPLQSQSKKKTRSTGFGAKA